LKLANISLLPRESVERIQERLPELWGPLLDLRDILDDAGCGGTDSFGDSILAFTKSGTSTLVSIDADGAGGSAATTVATLLNISLMAADTNNYLV
jgi:hypothetical protein